MIQIQRDTHNCTEEEYSTVSRNVTETSQNQLNTIYTDQCTPDIEKRPAAKTSSIPYTQTTAHQTYRYRDTHNGI